MYYIIRNGNSYGPYDEQTLQKFVNAGKLLHNDIAEDQFTGEKTTLGEVLSRAGMQISVEHQGTINNQLSNIGKELILPIDLMKDKSWKQDTRLLMLAFVGLTPSVLMFISPSGVTMFYMVSLYFSAIWGLFFYYFFKTRQVTLKTTLTIFFGTQFFVFLLFFFTRIPFLNPFYNFTDSFFPLNLVGFVLGVGLNEEFCKSIPLHILEKKSREPLIPQTMVYYGLMSGIAFGVFEGVRYQTSVNVNLEYSESFFYNIARLTSLPFLHAIWCGISGYFIALANLYPKYRKSLYLLSLAIPSLLHGIYDTSVSTPILTLLLAIPTMLFGVILLNTYLRTSADYQNRLHA